MFTGMVIGSLLAAQSACPRAAIEVEWHGNWYPAQVISGPDAMGRCEIDYDGYGASWNEWVGSERMRQPASTKPAGVAKQSASERKTVSLEGEWRCAANGNIPIGVLRIQGLHYMFTVTMNTAWRPDSPKDKGNGSGNFQRTGNAITPKSGPLQNNYKVVGSIYDDTITFNYSDGGASMLCRKQQ
jgi:hypothetical protein